LLCLRHFLFPSHLASLWSHDDVILYAIASRDAATAQTHARKYHFQWSYGSYEALLADPLVDFVYISVPNALHFEWAFKALAAGKHVLLEKPFTSTSIEAAKLSAKAKECGKILMEAFHWQFHPAAHRLRQLLDTRELGAILKTNAIMTSTPSVPSPNIRWKYNLSGGSLMDMSYVVSFTRYVLHAELPEEVVHAKATPARSDPRVDVDMLATLRYKRPSMYARAGLDPTDVYSTVYSSLVTTWKYGL
jgi:predicted dehydrogenase